MTENLHQKIQKIFQGDCFSGNLAICAENGATFVACNAHARRYFKKALLNYKSKSEEALHLFGQMFEIERTAKELQLKRDDVKLMREQESKPVLDDLKVWLDKEQLLALPKSTFGKAVNYCLNNWDGLTAYVQDGDLTIDNNSAEREMKRVATGRKAWLFFGSDNGGENAEVLLSIISTCKRHGVEPFAYLRDVIDRLVQNPDTDLETLLPHTWNQEQSAPKH
jgi:transposase